MVLLENELFYERYCRPSVCQILLPGSALFTRKFWRIPFVEDKGKNARNSIVSKFFEKIAQEIKNYHYKNFRDTAGEGKYERRGSNLTYFLCLSIDTFDGL
jgi:hypothetical protein